MSIIKRKKQDKFFIMSNHATQKDLTSLQSIGLLAYITSLPEDWILYKTFLQKKFTRRTVDSAWKELVQKNYIAGFTCYAGKEKKYFYLASDEALSQEEYDQFIQETLEEIKEEGLNISNIKPIPDCNFSTVRFVQYKKDSTSSTVQNDHIQINTNKDIEQKNNKKEIDSVNTEQLNSMIIDHHFEKQEKGLFDREDKEYFKKKILIELKEQPHDPYKYFESIVDLIAYKRKKKNGMIVNEVYNQSPNFYNWLEA